MRSEAGVKTISCVRGQGSSESKDLFTVSTMLTFYPVYPDIVFKRQKWPLQRKRKMVRWKDMFQKSISCNVTRKAVNRFFKLTSSCDRFIKPSNTSGAFLLNRVLIRGIQKQTQDSYGIESITYRGAMLSHKCILNISTRDHFFRCETVAFPMP